MGASVNVLGETYSLEDQEDSAQRVVTKLWLYMQKVCVPVLAVTDDPRSSRSTDSSKESLPTGVLGRIDDCFGVIELQKAEGVLHNHSVLRNEIIFQLYFT